MKSIHCLRAMRLVHARAGGSDADRLWLEEHLDRCDGCRQETRDLDAVRSLLLEMPAETPALQERVVKRALAAASHHRPVMDHASSFRGVVIAASAAAAAAVAVGVWSYSAAPEIALTKTRPVPSSRVVAGWLEGDGAPRVGPSAKVDAVDRVAQGSTELRLAAATARLEAGTRFRWRRSHRELALESGRASLSIESVDAQSLQVTTSSFRVVTLAARFEVTPDVVVVTEGEVRVLDLDGDVLAELHGPSRWSAAPPVDQGLGEIDREAARVEVERERRNAAAASWLQQAREAISLGNLEVARRRLRVARASLHRVSDAAEADSLEAELALVSGDVPGAIRRYRVVAQRYRRLSAGESALFAAARLTARNDHGAAQRLFREYVSRYPEGRFLDEAARHLEQTAP